MENHLSLGHFNWTVFKGVISLYVLEYFIKMSGKTCFSIKKQLLLISYLCINLIRLLNIDNHLKWKLWMQIYNATRLRYIHTINLPINLNTDLLLFGSTDLMNTLNIDIFLNVQKFIISSKRFTS